MTPKERKVVFTLIGIMFIIMVSVIIMKSSKGAQNNTANTPSKQETEMQDVSNFMQNAVNGNVNNTDTNNTNTSNTENTINNNNINDINNETNTNTITNSESNNNTTNVKTYKTILITNIQYKSEDGGNKITADITNASTTNFASEVAKLTLIKSTGEQIQTTIIIPSIEAGKTDKLEHLLDEDVNNIIDFKIEEI